MSNKTEQTNVRLSATAKRLLQALAQKLGVSQAAVLEMAIRKFAESESIQEPTHG
jgi:predicted transcriptional regulator